MKKLLFASMCILIVLSSCQDENEEQSVELTPDEARELVENTGTQLSGDVVSLVESGGVKELMHIANLLSENDVVIGGRKSQKNWTKERLEIIVKYFVDGPSARAGSDAPTTLEEIKGLYTWNFELQDFDFEESEFFIVVFPTEGSQVNDAEFRITTLEYVTITEMDGGVLISELTAPSEINAFLKVDDVTLVELDYTVNWVSSGFPEKANVTLFIHPFGFSINFDDTFPTTASLLASISIDNENIIGIDLDVTYENESKENPNAIEGNVQYRGLKIEGNVDLTKIGEDGDPNDFVNLTLISEENAVGDIVFVLTEDEDGFKEYLPYVQHSDGTQQNLEDILAPVLEEIESLFAEFE
ncbi:MAG: hypothetical protein ABJG47_02770 [Ekhidna sp.]